MTVFVLGSTGMLGHQVLRYFQQRGQYRTIGTNRVHQYWNAERGDTVINCIGLVKQRPECNDPLQAIEVNSLLPHILADTCSLAGARLIHISTDCVFSGKKGNYTEDDTPDPVDLYGRSKLLGEVGAPHLTLRTSVIGPELHGRKQGLLEWFLAQKEQVKGYMNAYFSGLTTLELAKVLHNYVIPDEKLQGLYHVAGPTISKFHLLAWLSTYYDTTGVIAVDGPAVDRSLDATRFWKVTSFAPLWSDMISEMRNAA